jgi:hypothetical protein
MPSVVNFEQSFHPRAHNLAFARNGAAPCKDAVSEHADVSDRLAKEAERFRQEADTAAGSGTTTFRRPVRLRPLLIWTKLSLARLENPARDFHKE